MASGVTEVGVWTEATEIINFYNNMEKMYKEGTVSPGQYAEAMNTANKDYNRICMNDMNSQKAYYQTMFGPIKVPEKHMGSWLQAANVGEQSLYATISDIPGVGFLKQMLDNWMINMISDKNASVSCSAFYSGASERARAREASYRHGLEERKKDKRDMEETLEILQAASANGTVNISLSL